MLITSIRENFSEIIELLNQLNDEDYIFCHPELSNATIGEHTRHIIELYQALIDNYNTGVINYDKRARNILIQTSIIEAKKAINSILSKIELPNKKLILEQGTLQIRFSVDTNYFRELLYNLEHSIHHQALIKVAIIKNQNIEISHNFGVAKSTIEFKTQCAQ
ncbi:DinB family protein [Flavobacterium sediminilitoris]|uniref:DinB family protein n=1 Tax=Flavobacterium sediminilitoris TaxID=2024526 RepID=A0ABY4HJ67_9FLAO|nr:MULTISPECIES: DinB family protein [Flavobacterium]UOX32603.1 DinB family protein [Flavobacterium sediminilitoris]